LQAKEQS